MRHWLLIRHGESENNVLGEQGQENRVPSPSLTETGLEQAEALARRWLPASERQKTELMEVFGGEGGRLVCSPMVRALQTIEPLAKATKKDVWVEPLLFERGGVWKDDHETYQSPTWGGIAKRFPFARLPIGGSPNEPWFEGRRETWEEASVRVGGLLERWCEEACGGPTIGVTHCDVIDLVIRIANGEPPGGPLQYRTPNGAGVWVVLEGGKMRIQEMSVRLV